MKPYDAILKLVEEFNKSSENVNLNVDLYMEDGEKIVIGMSKYDKSHNILHAAISAPTLDLNKIFKPL